MSESWECVCVVCMLFDLVATPYKNYDVCFRMYVTAAAAVAAEAKALLCTLAAFHSLFYNISSFSFLDNFCVN